MAKNARTHDISLIDYHVTDIETFGKVLNTAVATACPKVTSSRYSQVYVLLLSWADDDLGVQVEIDGLEAVLRDDYGYQTDQWKIPTSMSHNALSFRIMQSLVSFEAKDKLFITYYAGHGYMNEERQCVWLCNQQEGASTVQWSSIQTNLEEATCDNLILLDCCAAASSGGNAGKGVTEVIAACGFEAFAPGVGEHSFTSNLTEELKYLAREKRPFTTAFLHNKLLARLKSSWNPRFANETHQERRRTPIYIQHIANDEKPRCIQLDVSNTASASAAPSINRDGSFDPSSGPSASSASSSEDVDMLGLEEISKSSISADGVPHRFASPHVLISVAIQDEEMLHTLDWLDWFTSIPVLAKSVCIQGIYKSDSTLLQLSLPVALWDVMPDNPAVSFIAFIKTDRIIGNRGDHKPGHSTRRLKRSHSAISQRTADIPENVRKVSHKQQEPDSPMVTFGLLSQPPYPFELDTQGEISGIQNPTPPTSNEPSEETGRLRIGVPVIGQHLPPVSSIFMPVSDDADFEPESSTSQLGREFISSNQGNDADWQRQIEHETFQQRLRELRQTWRPGFD
ncbi:MAG: hypothetical protein Q9174_004535 [Haloplaca sp. 1 TL-2023]